MHACASEHGRALVVRAGDEPVGAGAMDLRPLDHLTEPARTGPRGGDRAVDDVVRCRGSRARPGACRPRRTRTARTRTAGRRWCRSGSAKFPSLMSDPAFEIGPRAVKATVSLRLAATDLHRREVERPSHVVAVLARDRERRARWVPAPRGRYSAEAPARPPGTRGEAPAGIAPSRSNDRSDDGGQDRWTTRHIGSLLRDGIRGSVRERQPLYNARFRRPGRGASRRSCSRRTAAPSGPPRWHRPARGTSR